jgi:hypothetical protein
MKTIRMVLVGAILATAVIIALITSLLLSEPILTLELKQFYLEAYKAAGIGFLVAVLGVIIPQLLPEARDRFERFKDSRIAYSEAKTSVIYLREKLCTVRFGDAVAAVQDAHKKLHLAETYTELRSHLVVWHPRPETWVDRNYWELMAVRTALQRTVNDWDDLSVGKRFGVVDGVLEKVESVFGTDNEKWSQEDPDEDKWEQKRKRERRMEDALKSWFPKERITEASSR